MKTHEEVRRRMKTHAEVRRRMKTHAERITSIFTAFKAREERTTLTHSHTLTLTLTLHSHSHSHSLSLTHSHSHSLTLTLKLALALALTLTLTHSPTLALTLSHSHSATSPRVSWCVFFQMLFLCHYLLLTTVSIQIHFRSPFHRQHPGCKRRSLTTAGSPKAPQGTVGTPQPPAPITLTIIPHAGQW